MHSTKASTISEVKGNQFHKYRNDGIKHITSDTCACEYGLKTNCMTGGSQVYGFVKRLSIEALYRGARRPGLTSALVWLRSLVILFTGRALIAITVLSCIMIVSIHVAVIYT